MTKGPPMKHDSWQFPIVPTFLTGLMLEHVSKLQAKILRHGMLVGTAKLGQVFCLKVRDPGPMMLMLIGTTENFDLLVLDGEEGSPDDLIPIKVDEPKLRGRILWNRHVMIADVLLVLDSETVIKTSELTATSVEGPN